MDALGGYRDVGVPARLLAGALFAGILCLVAVLERLQHALRQTEGSRWWASNGRDVLNLFAFGVLAYGLALLGFFGPLVVLLAACMMVLLTGFQGGLGEGRKANIVSALLTLCVGLPPLVMPRALVTLAELALERLT